MPSKSRTTLADVAARAGVSKMTASRALRDAADVSPVNRKRVKDAAKTMGYVANPLAASLSNNRSNLIGVIVPSLSNIVFAEVLSGIADGIAGSTLQPVFGVTDYDPEAELQTIRNMLSWNPAGLIVTGVDQSPEARTLLEHAAVPIVQIMDTDGIPIDACVGLSHRAAGAEMAKTMLAQGHRSFGYIGCGLDKDTRAKKRHDAFKRALSENGVILTAIQQSDGPSTIAKGRVMTAEMLQLHPDLDCIYYANDDLAAGGALHCIAHALMTPQLAGFNGLDIIASLPIGVATTQTQRREIGRAAAQLVRDRQTQELPTHEKQIVLTPRLVLDSRTLGVDMP